jgi:surface carbohydrate biosynthesis protein (TIGR04326 family)
MQMAIEPVSALLINCDVAYTSAITSAAVEAYCIGVPVVSALDPKKLNLSPLRKCKGVYFATTPEELAYSILFAASTTHSTDLKSEFFNLDNNLIRWKKLLLK